MEFVKISICVTVDIFTHCHKNNKKIKRADQILPEVYVTNLNGDIIVLGEELWAHKTS